jgi:hypothetical protein
MTAPQQLSRIAAALAVLLLALLTGCASDSGDNELGEEVTQGADPGEEPTGPEEPNDPGPNAVAVELPGVPVGGSGAVFFAPETQCVDVNLTGITLPEGVTIVITGFTVPGQFTIDPGQCGDAAPCLTGHVFSSAGLGCQVAVTWTGEPVDSGSVELGVSSATVTCADESLCQDAVAAVQAAGLQTITLSVQFTEDSPSEESPSEDLG